MPKISFACDHRGFEVKDLILDFLKKNNYQVEDCGTNSSEAADYPDHMLKAAELIAKGQCEKGIGVCYTGIGSAIAANKVAGVRAALVKTTEEAKLSRAHNDSNMLILGAGFLSREALLAIIETWLKTPFEGGRHAQRVDKIKRYEERHCK